MSRGAKSTAAYNEINRKGGGGILLTAFTVDGLMEEMFSAAAAPDKQQAVEAAATFVKNVMTSPRGKFGCHYCNCDLGAEVMPAVMIVQQSTSLECEKVLVSGLCEDCAGSPDANERILKPIRAIWPKADIVPIFSVCGSA
jgi:hypothetical protein